jgi:ABC-type cobalamin/Fe3+-siderophores transport system ATPase subunit
LDEPTAHLDLQYQIGLLDLVSLALSVIPFVLLIKDRRWYLARK